MAQAETEHDDVVLVVPLIADLGAAKVARDRLNRLPALCDDILDDMKLIVSELVSNAVRHGRPEIVLRVEVGAHTVGVSVCDHGAQMPPDRLVPAAPDATSGRGLAIVDLLAARWGVEPLADGSGTGTDAGKTVWATLDLTERRAS